MTKNPPARSRRSSGAFVSLPAVVAALALLIIFTMRCEPTSEPAAAPQAAQPATTAAGPPPQALPPFSEAEIAAAERITVEEARELQQEDAATFIDVRDLESYRAAHIPGALQISLVYLGEEIPFFPRDRKLIPYCT